MIGKGRVCLKTAGREAGRYCVVLEQPHEGFVTIAGPKTVTGVKRRKCSMFHIEPTQYLMDTGGGTDMELESGWKGSGLIEKLGIQISEKRKTAKVAKERPRDARVLKAAQPKAKPAKGKK
jgi:large subunit ribosomal protein L14e